MVSSVTKAANAVYNNQSLQNYVKAVSSDGRINQAEKTQLNDWLQEQKLPKADKELLSNFLDKLSESTTGTEEKRTLFSRKTEEVTTALSPQNLKSLESLAQKNPLALSLLNTIKSVQGPVDTSSAKSVENSNFAPNSVNFGAKPQNVRNGQPVQQANSRSASADVESKFMPPGNASVYARSQYGTGLKSEGGDCGPTSAIMILRANGFNVDSKDITRMRTDVKASTTKAPFAISFDQMKRMVEKESGGQLKAGPVKAFPTSEKGRDTLVDYLRNELKSGKMPAMVTGVTPKSLLTPEQLAANPGYKGTGGHYTVVVGVNENGSIKVADPSGGNVRDYSPEELMARMKIRNAQVMSFSRN